MNTYYTNSYLVYERNAVFAHEIGHGLGLSDISNTSALMHRDDSRVVYTPTQDEINGVNYLY
ncbi:matrixin family metalloprotease [Paenibacillus sp. NPDC093718]|uniref:matrixin family metalloprotease n=1 Tax=Paenibacillus sp. NPDC093718 TaxID=3390601 RepID=UPI003D06E3F4